MSHYQVCGGVQARSKMLLLLLLPNDDDVGMALIRSGPLRPTPKPFSLPLPTSSSSSSIGVQELLPIPPTVIRPGL